MQRFSIAELEAALDRLGADVETWPPELRAAALELVANSQDARTVLEAAQQVDRALSAPIKAPSGLADRIFDLAMKQSPPKPGPAPRPKSRR